MRYHMQDMKRRKPARPGEIIEALLALSVTVLATALLLALAVCLT
jgi:hypothetical protein